MATDRLNTTRAPQRHQTQFVLNVVPISLDDKADMPVGLIPYIDHDQLRSLQDTHRSTHVIRRHKLDALDDDHDTTNQIAAIPIVANPPQVGTTFRNLLLRDNLGHVAAMIRESLISYFAAFPRRVLDYRPITFLAEGTNDNLLHQSLPKGTTCPGWLGVNPLFELDVRVIEIVRGEPFIGICINLFTRKRIEANCQQMLDDGFPIVGHYVKRLMDTTDARIQPHLQLAGKAASVDGGVIHLVDHRDDVVQIDASAAYLETAAFDDVLRHVFKSTYGAVRTKMDSALERFSEGAEKLSRLERLRSYLEGHPLEFLPGQTWKIGKFLSEGDGTFPPIRIAPPVTYVFDSTGQKTDTWPVRGIDTHGPYSTPTFSPTEPRICVICQKPHRGRVEQFIRKFLHGIGPASQRAGGGMPAKKQPFEKGSFENMRCWMHRQNSLK